MGWEISLRKSYYIISILFYLGQRLLLPEAFSIISIILIFESCVTALLTLKCLTEFKIQNKQKVFLINSWLNGKFH